MNLSIEPVWPWSAAGTIVATLLLAALTVWTYLGVPGATRRRIATVMVLRLLALAVAFLLLLRPSLGFAHLEGIEPSQWLVVFDASASMNTADGPTRTTRWQHVTQLWQSSSVQRRLTALKNEQKINVVKYLGADDLRPGEPNAIAAGKRTDIGGWLHQLGQKHGHEKHLRGIALFSDGADNGTRFVVLDKARAFRGVCRIDTFGVGDAKDVRAGKDIALTQLRVEPTPVPVKSKMTVRALAQSPGFDNVRTDVAVWIESTSMKQPRLIAEVPGFAFKQAKDQPIVVTCDAPDVDGEYKLTLKAAVQPEESNKDNNEISTFIQVVKEQIHVLWVDRPRVYEPTFALRYALVPEPRFKVRYAEPASKETDAVAWYQLDKPGADVLVIGDLSAAQFCMGDERIFEQIKSRVEKKMGLLFLGGAEAFAAGGWDRHKPIRELLPVKLDKSGYSEAPARPLPTRDGLQHPFIQLDPDPAKNDELWKVHFEELDGLAALGSITEGGAELLKTRNNDVVMAMRRFGEGRVIAFAGDSTSRSWFGSAPAVDGYKRFWKQLVFWLSQQHDATNQVWVHLDKRRIGVGDTLGFTFGFKGKTGSELANSRFTAKLRGPQKEQPLAFVRNHDHQRGSVQDANEPGEHQIAITATAEVEGVQVTGSATARFFVENDDREMLYPAADHETLRRIADAAEGRFQLAEESALLQLLDELAQQVNSESRTQTTHWPDWKRLPASDQPRDQLVGIWRSFGLASLLLFTLLIGGEWMLRRRWGMA